MTPLVHEGIRYEAHHWGRPAPTPPVPPPPAIVKSDPGRALQRAGYSPAEAHSLLERQRLQGLLAHAVRELNRAASQKRVRGFLGAALEDPDSVKSMLGGVLEARRAGQPPVDLDELRTRLSQDLSAEQAAGVVSAWAAAGCRSLPDASQDPDSLRVQLACQGSGRADIETAVGRLRVQVAAGNAMGLLAQEQMARMLAGFQDLSGSPAFEETADLLSQLDSEHTRELLAAEGLAPPEIEEALALLRAEREGLTEACEVPPRRAGGLVAAYAVNSGDLLWEAQAYSTTYDENLETCVQDVFITGFEVEGAHLVVRDERRRLHRLDLRTGQVLGSGVDPRPTAHDLAQQAIRELPPQERKRLWDQLWELKGLMDQHNFSAYGLAPAPARELEGALDRFLGSLGEVTGRASALEAAWRAGVKHAAAIRQGQDAHLLYNWLQEELQPVFLVLFETEADTWGLDQ